MLFFKMPVLLEMFPLYKLINKENIVTFWWKHKMNMSVLYVFSSNRPSSHFVSLNYRFIKRKRFSIVALSSDYIISLFNLNVGILVITKLLVSFCSATLYVQNGENSFILSYFVIEDVRFFKNKKNWIAVILAVWLYDFPHLNLTIKVLILIFPSL